MENNIEVKNLNKEYEGFSLKDISFNIPKGSIVGLIGENGAGKTTTIKSILNIIKSDGEIRVFGKDIKKYEKEIKKKLGVVLDESFLSEYLTPKKINCIMSNFYEDWNKTQFEDYIKNFKLPENKMIKDFSSGMKMKLKIATAIAHNPKILILDEQRSILISSHITTDLEHISDYIMFIKDGEITLNLPTSEILENYGIVKCDENTFNNIEKQDIKYYKREKYQYEVLVDNKDLIKRKYNIATIDKASIEDIMLFYIRGKNK